MGHSGISGRQIKITSTNKSFLKIRLTKNERSMACCNVVKTNKKNKAVLENFHICLHY